MQRKLESAIRRAKDRQTIAAAAGDDILRREEQAKLNMLSRKYKDFSDAAGLPTKAERAAVSGYHRVKSFDELKDRQKDSIIKLPDIQIQRSVGAKAKNYDIELPNKEIVHLTEGTRVTNIEVIAGKGKRRQIDEIDLLVERYGGKETEWRKMKGFGYVDYDSESYKAELHWYEEPTAGRHKWKVKPDKDGNWFYDD